MNEIDFKLRKLGSLVIDIETFDFSNTPKKTGGEVVEFKKLVKQKEDLIKEIKEMIK